ITKCPGEDWIFGELEHLLHDPIPQVVLERDEPLDRSPQEHVRHLKLEEGFQVPLELAIAPKALFDHIKSGGEQRLLVALPDLVVRMIASLAWAATDQHVRLKMDTFSLDIGGDPSVQPIWFDRVDRRIGGSSTLWLESD